ncbi:MAG TPA: hypothetical protein VHL98_17770 [Microvirga sp.]|jgi:hypothetical protein|nr:hypothetical protein [Microvirga sp.]
MPSTDKPPRSRLAAFVKIVVVFAVLAAVVNLTMAAFEWGVLTGLSAGAGVIVIYSIPAAFLGWPHVGLADVVDFVVGLFDAVVSFFAGLFE